MAREGVARISLVPYSLQCCTVPYSRHDHVIRYVAFTRLHEAGHAIPRAIEFSHWVEHREVVRSAHPTKLLCAVKQNGHVVALKKCIVTN